jgi:hypothetical protein
MGTGWHYLGIAVLVLGSVGSLVAGCQTVNISADTMGDTGEIHEETNNRPILSPSIPGL